jgi:Copper type II ascorbate-dependent monooxygenase, C-terminal domain
MTTRGWIAAALASLLIVAAATTLLRHKAGLSTERQGNTTAYRPVKRGKLEFNKQIAPVVYGKCAKCHYQGSAAPFPLTSYREVRNHARAIRRALDRGLMPPWKPDRGVGEFLGDRALTDQEKGMLKQWLAEGCREGDPSKKPAPPKAPSKWSLGPPDDILQMTESFKIPADGNDIYRCFVIPTNYPEDRWVRAADFEPGNPKVVHHALLFVDTSGQARARDAAEAGPGFTAFGALGFEIAGQLGGFVVGAIPHPLPDGVGYFLPKGADIVMQVHYHPTGKEETDCSQVGLYFCKQPVDKKLRVLEVVVPPGMLRIPPGESNCVFWAEQWMPPDVTVLQVFPHMHLIGRAIETTAILPDGSVVPIVRVSDWDLRWQNIYNLKNPLDLPEGSRLRLEARYDNTSGNPRNPNNPPKPVRFGFGSFDEMCIVWIGYTVNKEFLTRNIAAPSTYPDHFLTPWGKFSAGRK